MKKYVSNRLLERKIKKKDVASKMGISTQALYKSLGSDLRLTTLLKIADALGGQLGIYFPDTKAFKRITKEDINA